MTQETKKLVLLDAHAILHRAYHALPPFSSPSGEPTGALYGFTTMLIKLIRDLGPDYIAACFDMAGPTFRHTAYKEYKAQRPEVEKDLISQFKRSTEILKFFGIPVHKKEGFEADDIIGTIIEQNKNKKALDIVIASGDLDTLQLVNGKKVMVYTLKKGNEEMVYDEKAVEARFGFRPEFMADFKGLKGDPSDNIPGVAGIGDKTATALIQKFGHLEKILKTAEKAPDSMKKEGVKDRIINLLVEGSEEALFSKTLAVIRKDVPIKFNLQNSKWSGFNPKNIENIFRELGFNRLLSRISEEETKKAGETEAPGKLKYPENSAVEEKIKIAAWLLDSKRINISYEEAMHIAGADEPGMALEYYENQVSAADLRKVYEEIELPLSPVLKKMEKKGILVDAGLLKKTSQVYEKKLSLLTEKIHKLAGVEFNVNSTKELRKVLFEKLEIKSAGIKKTEGGLVSTRESELKKIQDKHPVVSEILKHREISKIKSTYLDAIPNLIDEKKRLHTTFLQTGTVTGRLASRDPNMQNIPIKGEGGKEVRRAFVAPKGRVLLAMDYSQIELRVAAVISGDKKMKDAFLSGKDIHSATASEVFNVPESEVSKEMRRKAKVINFGILYGMGVRALGEGMGVSAEEAKAFYSEYFNGFPGIKEYTEDSIKKARRYGYVETMFGRKRFLPEINSKMPRVRAEAERMAVNFPIQGTATGDIIKLAMVRIDNMLGKDKKLKGKADMILQIHDELLFEIDKDVLEYAVFGIKDIMEGVLDTDVPIKVEAEAGSDWASMEHIERD